MDSREWAQSEIRNCATSARTVAASGDGRAIKSEIERCHRALGSPSNVIAPPGDDAARLLALARMLDAVAAAAAQGERATAQIEAMPAAWRGVRHETGAPFVDTRMLLVDAIHFVAEGRPYGVEDEKKPFPQLQHAETVVRLVRAHQGSGGERLGGESTLKAIREALRLSKRKPDEHSANGFWKQIEEICELASLGRITSDSLSAKHGAWKKTQQDKSGM